MQQTRINAETANVVCVCVNAEEAQTGAKDKDVHGALPV
jgi:hypothetical protein